MRGPVCYRFGMPSIRELREAKGLTQEQLAKLVKTSQPQIKRLEKGERKLTKEWAQRLGPHLGISAQSLLFEGTAPQATGYASPPEFMPAKGPTSASAAFIEELARAGVEPNLIGKAYDALAAARIEGALARDRRDSQD